MIRANDLIFCLNVGISDVNKHPKIFKISPLVRPELIIIRGFYRYLKAIYGQKYWQNVKKIVLIHDGNTHISGKNYIFSKS